ncbi:uncharacterized protein LOC100900240 [Galendromus occidentalis]|uniref:Uncharacterized protein LOC100900240 n=1 Tax=Galendromus occidentalis TaxID=34638 RepID=A0AAJ7PB23_9ACAR|nr:uncharacterized protein LOC100900240 [Galendromus occidentalis]XP_018497376.1 uncharacterized protein LOC100900240 [Galendromus occidentalis]
MNSVLSHIFVVLCLSTAVSSSEELNCTGPGIVDAIMAKIAEMPELDPYHSEPMSMLGAKLVNITFNGLSRMKSAKAPRFNRLDNNTVQIIFPIQYSTIFGNAAYEMQFFKGGVRFTLKGVVAEFDGVLDTTTDDVKLTKFRFIHIGDIDVKVDGPAQVFAGTIKQEVNNKRHRFSSKISKKVPVLFNEKDPKIDLQCLNSETDVLN